MSNQIVKSTKKARDLIDQLRNEIIGDGFPLSQYQENLINDLILEVEELVRNHDNKS